MERGLLSVIVSELPDIIEALFSQRNKERMTEFRKKTTSVYENTEELLDDLQDHIYDINEDARAAANLLLEIIADPLKEAGIELPKSRSTSVLPLKKLFDKEIEKRITILPFEADPK